METLGNRLKKARLAKKLTQGELALKIGSYQKKYQHWEVDRHEPDIDTLNKLAEALEVSIEWLAGKTYHQVREIPAQYDSPQRKAPLISWVRAGKLHDPADNLHPGDSEGPPVPTYCKDPQCFALRVDGDSMEPEFNEGDIIIVSPNVDSPSGSYVIARVDGQVTFKQLRRHGDTILLHPLNPRHNDIMVQGSKKKSFKIIGKIVEKIRRY